MHDNKDHLILADEIKSIADLKSHIEKHHGVPSDTQIIVTHNFIADNEWNPVRDRIELLPGEWKMYKKISPNESVAVTVSPRLIVTGCLPDSVFQISSEKSVFDLKLMIDKELGVPPHRQILTTMTVFMKNEHPLRDYIVARSLKIQLDEIPVTDSDAMKVRIHGKGVFWDLLKVDKYDTVYALHGYVRRKGIASGHDFYVTCEDGLRLAGTSSLEELGITNGAHLYLVSGNGSGTDSSSDNNVVADE
ncbi:Ubiquitin supergroup [Thalictrum thalictroides]|uniref:Ubiquitin supergroup n=1 Tax=Thalictrum thalictroides TaxID=46969 RepID=A0A7J6W4L7_THATH|nr:Ubiquitin supergroup [Thalictrum thalictroides]